ncbi:tRNA pseudouridine(55) synthase TruB [Methylomonas sp. UP202]|uniref:tRNA pseudouridine(55) synthase TruB n=1 Tax=Methylomonas sp. UP202 TaxID=3040943 RepID=UPI002479BE8F|nr:tRNA pseudouridine(55) synthase TruB [Methylomonas sp. UP202]WGS87984.1 tRNA pseudouridine(55) synthase TruB [Methylomonas sp. UP202]
MAKRKSGRDVHGIVLLDKRQGVSSNKALQEVRHLFNANKAGHTGALDPLATGLLPLCFGEATKVSGMLLDDDKRYTVSMRLGVMTDTGDSDGNIVAEMPVPVFSEAVLQAALLRFTGAIDQVPPMYSALKHNGRKLYELAREGLTIERKARPVSIYALTLLAASDRELTLDVVCSKGTYIRSLVEDLGQALGSCATVIALRRTEAGLFRLAQAYTFEQLQAMSSEQLQAVLIAPDEPLRGVPALALAAEEAGRIRQGQQIEVGGGQPGPVRIYGPETFLGLGEILLNGKLAPRKLFLMDDRNA